MAKTKIHFMLQVQHPFPVHGSLDGLSHSFILPIPINTVHKIIMIHEDIFLYSSSEHTCSQIILIILMTGCQHCDYDAIGNDAESSSILSLC
jgi:hypothetical protein